MAIKNLQFTIEGNYITDTADQLLKSGDMKKAMRIIKGSTVSDQLSENEHRQLIYDILDGKARIVGTCPGDDYDVIYPDERKESSNIADTIAALKAENEGLKTETEAQKERLTYILNYLEQHASHILHEMAFNYREDYEEKLFEDYENDTEYTQDAPWSDMLESYIKRMNLDTKDDYGWLEPNGTYHPVEWGEHESWAADCLTKKFSKEKLDELYVNDEGLKIPATDVMIYKLKWVLLHNPANGLATHTSCPGIPLTKEVKKFLYNYYNERKQYKQANDIYRNGE